MTTNTLDTLLALDPISALVKMLNLANGTSYRLDAFTVSKPTVVNGIVTTVTLTGKAALNEFDDQRTAGALNLTYNRLDMGGYLQGVLAGYQPKLPLSTQNILDEITARIGQQFYIDDMVLEEVTRDNGAQYRLKAKPESLRWVGFIDLPLIALSPIQYLFNSNALAAVTDVSPVTFSPNAHLPYLNATDYRDFAEGLRVGDLAQDRSTFRTLFNAVVHDPSPVGAQSAPWYANVTPGPFNLYNAKVVRFDTGAGFNAAIPNLERAVVLQIDGTYTTNFKSGEIAIPYTLAKFNSDGWTDKPRIHQGSSLSLSDGSQFGSYLNTLPMDSTITSVPANFLIDGPTAWEAVDGIPSPTNLYGAQITYNGLRRATDLPPVYKDLDRVLEVLMSLNNSVWEGTYLFHYAGPIQMPIRELRLSVGSACYVDFTPTQGTGPYSYSIVTGTLPDGLVLDPVNGTLTGTATAVGDFQYTLSISDSASNTCLFTIHQRVSEQIAALTLTGSLPPGTAGEPYTAYLKINGGLAPYTTTVTGGRLPGSVALTVINATLRLAGLLPAADTYRFAVGVTSADGQTTSLSLVLPITGDGGYAPILLSGDFSDPQIGTLYAQAMTVSGGDGLYSNPRVTSGTLPAGLALSVSGNLLWLTGTPSGPIGPAGFTVAVDSGDGQTATRSQALGVLSAPPSVTLAASWTYLATFTGHSVDDVAYSPELGLYLAVNQGQTGDGANYLASVDGVTWSTRSFPASSRGTTYSNILWVEALQCFVAGAGNAGSTYMRSADGITWTKSEDSNYTGGRMAYAPELGLFASTGQNDYSSRTSVDGLTWNSLSAAGNTTLGHGDSRQLIWASTAGLFVSIASTNQPATNRIKSSPDGKAWTAHACDASLQTAIAYSPSLDLFVAGGSKLGTSKDLNTWTLATVQAPIGQVAWSNELELFVAVPNTSNHVTSPVYYTSTDGYAWQTVSLNTEYTVGLLRWLPGVECLVAITGQTNGKLYANPAPPVATAPTFVAASAPVYSTATSEAQSVPTGTQNGDLILAFVMHRSSLTPPAGWALLCTQGCTAASVTQTLSVFQRIASGDAGASYTWTQSALDRMAVHYQVYRKSTAFQVTVLSQTHANDYSGLSSIAWPNLSLAISGMLIAATTLTAANAAPSTSSFIAQRNSLTLSTQTTPSAVVDNRMGVAYVPVVEGDIVNDGRFACSVGFSDVGYALVMLQVS